MRGALPQLFPDLFGDLLQTRRSRPLKISNLTGLKHPAKLLLRLQDFMQTTSPGRH